MIDLRFVTIGKWPVKPPSRRTVRSSVWTSAHSGRPDKALRPLEAQDIVIRRFMVRESISKRRLADQEPRVHAAGIILRLSGGSATARVPRATLLPIGRAILRDELTLTV